MKILIIRLSSIGDVILTTPVLKSLREKFPDATIDFLVMDKFKSAVLHNKNINNIIVFEKASFKGIGGLIKFGKVLKKNDYDLVIDLHAKTRSVIISKIIGRKTLKYKKRPLIISLLIKARIIKNNYNESIVRKYYRPLKEIGLEYEGENIEFDFDIKDLVKIKEIIWKDEDKTKFVAFAPGASKNTKKWPKENFLALGKLIMKDSNIKVILVGGKNEYDEIEDIKKELGEGALNLAGKLTLQESGALFSLAEYVVTNDSGPFHIARGVGKTVFVIFGPTDPKMFEYNEKSLLIYAGVECSSCTLHGDDECPKKHFKCMRDITPEIVFKKIKETV